MRFYKHRILTRKRYSKSHKTNCGNVVRYWTTMRTSYDEKKNVYETENKMARFTSLIGLDIWETPADVRVIPVNTVGVMGRGLAKQAADRVPGLLEAYRKQCQDGFKVGEVVSYQHGENDQLTYVLFPSKSDWRERTRREYIVNGLLALKAWLLELQFERDGFSYHRPAEPLIVAIPPVGSGCGNIGYGQSETIQPQWVRAQIKQYLATVPNVHFYLF
ncbi:hypothetical protein DKS90_25515 [Salmonella enterica subsp. enterica serovar Muenchen]|nr:hypothetical protein [Salmonella enterica subsp. enterica serovar Muenchen]